MQLGYFVRGEESESQREESGRVLKVEGSLKTLRLNKRTCAKHVRGPVCLREAGAFLGAGGHDVCRRKTEDVKNLFSPSSVSQFLLPKQNPGRPSRYCEGTK